MPEFSFKILSQRQTQRLDAAGRIEQVMVISFESLPSHTIAEESIAVADYTPENVAAALMDRATAIEAIHAL